MQMGRSETICWTGRPDSADPDGMDLVPSLWTTAYAPSSPTALRLAARQLLCLRCLLRRLALTDHTPWAGY
ncbi:hypothetical protein GCM10009601_07360 [Streptomyces thermospinosisporus]|uniref:Uncharacterized protein n=1 Tax=Streptomyces thermospinosisporus TaxID=161482 RepID=A0ABP4JBU3_9ACTN